MAGKLITFPLRVWFRSARFLTRTTFDVAERAVSLAGETLGVISSDRFANGHHPDWQEPAPPTAEPSAPEPTGPEPKEPESAQPEASAAEPTMADARTDEPTTAEARTDERDEATPEPPPERPQPTPERSDSAVRPLQPEPPEAPAVEEPVHVSEEPELVRESAEPGAEEGAGAAVTVLEPWDGYQHMNAQEVIARAKRATPAELAAVRLYEAQHRSRQTVLAAVDRELKLGNGADPA